MKRNRMKILTADTKDDWGIVIVSTAKEGELCRYEDSNGRKRESHKADLFIGSRGSKANGSLRMALCWGHYAVPMGWLHYLGDHETTIIAKGELRMRYLLKAEAMRR